MVRARATCETRPAGERGLLGVVLLAGISLVEALELGLLVAAVGIALWRPRSFASMPPTAPGPIAPSGAPEPADALPDQAAWAERIRAETIRCGRHERSAAIVVIQLEAFDELLAAAEMDANRLCRAVVASLRRSARGFDAVFGDATGTFRVLLAEADERGARAYIDRVAQGALRPWMETIDREIRLTAVWAATSELTDLPAADRLAGSRLTGAQDGWIRSAFVLRT